MTEILHDRLHSGAATAPGWAVAPTRAAVSATGSAVAPTPASDEQERSTRLVTEPSARAWRGTPEYPPYWLVRDWSGAELDDVGRAIVERAIYVSAVATPSDHDTAVAIITDALCRWAHPDDIRWCHLPDHGSGGYTVIGTAIRAVAVGDPDREDDEFYR